MPNLTEQIKIYNRIFHGKNLAKSILSALGLTARAFIHRIHPLGSLNSDVRYEDLYAYLNCLEISPCRGWMNKNATLRDLTSQVGGIQIAYWLVNKSGVFALSKSS